ncbi:MAG: hypothetical protein QNJ55_12250 [Xenococcus sp. MO_188.B8]|nr:hypothetical protein [Xenococcus sp. MO_188.B8]
MLSNESKKSNRETNLDSSTQNFPDPWQNSSPEQKTTTVPETWNLLKETPPLINAAGIPGAPMLASHQSTSEEILLEDELKLKTSPSSLLKQQLEKALTLLFWNK